MKPLIVLLSAFAVALLTIKLIHGNYAFSLSAKIAMSVTLAFTAVAHFAFTRGMEMMLPVFIPYKKQMVYLTGIIEIAAAIGLFIPGLSVMTGWLLIVFFVQILPANIYAAVKNIDYQKADTQGNGLRYLWFRVPLQLLFIVWTYLSAIKNC